MSAIVSSLCPDGFELVKDGECRGKYVDETMYFDTAYDRIVSKCNEINALPIVIHNDEVSYYYLLRDRHCFVITV